jgi:hypothetical protein
MVRDAATLPSSTATIWTTSTMDTGTPPTKATTTNTDRQPYRDSAPAELICPRSAQCEAGYAKQAQRAEPPAARQQRPPAARAGHLLSRALAFSSTGVGVIAERYGSVGGV